MKKVSVIVPVYNVEEYLDKCLDSLVNQTLKDIEIIVVNDGTKDNSQEIVDRYVKEYPKMVFSYIKENGGLSSARNFGMKKATGEFIGFVDSDDYVEYDMYEQLYNKAKETKADIVCCQATYRYAIHGDKKIFTHPEYFGKSISKEPRILVQAKSYAWNKIYKRELWDNFEFPVQYFEDSAVVYNVMYTAKKIECVNLPLYNYIKERPGSITAEISPKMWDIFKSCDSILEFYRSKKDWLKLKEAVEEVCIGHLKIRLLYIYGSKNKKLTWKYYNDMKKYLRKNIKDYKKNPSMKYRFDKNDKYYLPKLAVVRTPGFFKLVTISPIGFMKKAYKLAKKPLGLIKRFIKNRSNSALETKRANIQKNGLAVLEETLEMLNNIKDVKAFADFGTLLGIVRENGLLKHDLDIDTAVLGKPNLYRYVTMLMERNGYKLWREYIIGGKVVEQSYHYKDTKVDVNYYEYNDKGVNTWLFFRYPKTKYPNNTRNIVRMNYAMVKNVKKIDVQGHKIYVPDCAERLLEEKYGKNWRLPDKGWIYWQSPAATILDEIGYFIDYRYPKF